jgi:DNA-binding LytR/AlgR family response regulator
VEGWKEEKMRTTLSALIVEDEELAQDLMQSYISKTAWVECVGVCVDALEALSVLHSTPIDILFLDVQMPEMSGIDFLKTLPTLHKNLPAVILTTAYSHYALASYDLNVVDYCLKPFSFERYVQAVNKAATWLRGRNAHEQSLGSLPQIPHRELLIKDRKGEVTIDFDDIVYCESFGNYVKIHTRKDWYITHQTLKSIEDLLPKTDFCRIHKTTIVAKRAVESILGNTVVIGGRGIPIGITYKHQVLSVLRGVIL